MILTLLAQKRLPRLLANHAEYIFVAAAAAAAVFYVPDVAQTTISTSSSPWRTAGTIHQWTTMGAHFA
jgi:hypothetical protein